MVADPILRNSNWAYDASSSPVWRCSTDTELGVSAVVAAERNVVAVVVTAAAVVASATAFRCTVDF